MTCLHTLSHAYGSLCLVLLECRHAVIGKPLNELCTSKFDQLVGVIPHKSTDSMGAASCIPANFATTICRLSLPRMPMDSITHSHI